SAASLHSHARLRRRLRRCVSPGRCDFPHRHLSRARATHPRCERRAHRPSRARGRRLAGMAWHAHRARRRVGRQRPVGRRGAHTRRGRHHANRSRAPREIGGRMTTFVERLRNIDWRIPAGVLALAILAAIPWWGPLVLSQLGYFHVRQVEIDGAVYVQPSRIIGRMRIDTTMSIWMNLTPIERRVASDPQVQSVAIERKLPGTLVVRLVENAPVALVEGGAGAPGAGKGNAGDAMRVVDAAGRALPIDPSRTNIDLPIVESADPSVLQMLADVRAHAPRLYAQISSVRRGARTTGGATSELDVTLPSVMVRALVGVSAARLADVIPVEADLARRHARVAELDLRYRDQVIARLQ